MNKGDDLNQRLTALEDRVSKLESLLNTKEDEEENVLMVALYERSKNLIIKHQKATLTFLQRQLYLDLARAEKIFVLLEKEGVVGPEKADGSRDVLKQ